MARLLQRSLECRLAAGGSLGSPLRFSSYAAWLLLLLAAGWPHLLYLARRTTDGSDDPWGLLAFATAMVFLPWDCLRREIPASFRWRFAWLGLPLLLLAPLWLVDHALLRAACWALALGLLLVRAGGAPALAGLLLMSLPVMASLDFYAGYPLRWLVSHANALVLNLLGLGVRAEGVLLNWAGREVVVDAPCSGLRMLWFGGYLTFATGALFRLPWRPLALLALAGLGLVVFGNGLRSLILFFPESGVVAFPVWAHGGVGMLLFAGVTLALVGLAQRMERART